MDWRELRENYLDICIKPRIPAAAHALVARHGDAGDRVVLTTATCRFLSELTAAHLGIEHLIATECELDAQGRFTGRSQGTLNMREGKVQRLDDWLATQHLALTECDSTLYSDSINDLPLLGAVTRAIAVTPDEQLAAVARERGWAIISLR